MKTQPKRDSLALELIERAARREGATFAEYTRPLTLGEAASDRADIFRLVASLDCQRDPDDPQTMRVAREMTTDARRMVRRALRGSGRR